MILVDEAVSELRSFADIVRWGASTMSEAGITFGHGCDNALDEAFNLVRFSLNLPHDIPSYMIHCRLTSAERRKAITLIKKRIESRKPAAYLTHQAFFAGLEFYVDERVLVPRSPMAEIIEQQFEPWINAQRVNRVLDLCTGSACIAIACAYAFPHAQVEASDLSMQALEVARLNMKRHHLEQRLTLWHADLFDGMEAQRQYDIIISNPPYVDAGEMQKLEAEFREEPLLGLAAGQDGLDVAKRILREAHHYLSEEGILCVEVGNSEQALSEQYPHIPFTWVEFERGGNGVFILTAQQAAEYSCEFDDG